MIKLYHFIILNFILSSSIQESDTNKYLISEKYRFIVIDVKDFQSKIKNLKDDLIEL